MWYVPMKLMIINPDYGMTRSQMDGRLSILERAAGADVSLAMECLEDTHLTLDSLMDAALAGPEIVRMAVQAERDGYDGIVLYCFTDPAVDACREAVRIPVIGGGQAAYLAATAVARQFGVIVSDAARIPEKRLFVHSTGVDAERVCAFEALRPGDPDGIPGLIEAGRRMIQRDGAQAVVLGCLSWLGLAGEISKALGVPVIDAAAASVAMSAALVRMNLATSKSAYPTPSEGRRLWSAGDLNIPVKHRVSNLCKGDLDMKKVLSFVLALALIMCAGSALAEQKSWVLAINATFPPFESIDDTTAGFVGIDIDLANYIAEKLGVKMEIQDMQFSALVPTLQSGRADIIISGISPTAERKRPWTSLIPTSFR